MKIEKAIIFKRCLLISGIFCFFAIYSNYYLRMYDVFVRIKSIERTTQNQDWGKKDEEANISDHGGRNGKSLWWIETD